MCWFQFPSVSKPQTIEKRYQGVLSGVMMDFMIVSIYPHSSTTVNTESIS